MYAVYVLNPDHQYIGSLDILDQAKELARDLVEEGYAHVEVWDPIIPLWSVWRQGARRAHRIYTSDDVVAYG